jgi:hypothetical protein
MNECVWMGKWKEGIAGRWEMGEVKLFRQGRDMGAKHEWDEGYRFNKNRFDRNLHKIAFLTMSQPS